MTANAKAAAGSKLSPPSSSRPSGSTKPIAQKAKEQEPNDSQESIETTKFIDSRPDAVRSVVRQLDRATGELLGIGNKDAPNLVYHFDLYRKALLRAAEKCDGRYITDVEESNLEACKFLMGECHVSVRHLKGIKSNILVSEDELTSDLSLSHPGEPTVKILYSNSRELVAQQRQLFQTLWSLSVPAEQRIKEIEEGFEPEETEMIRGVRETTERIIGFFSKAEKEVEVCATSAGPAVSMGVEIYRRAFLGMKQRGVHVRYLTEITNENLAFAKDLTKFVELKHIDGIKGSYAMSEREYTATTIEMKSGQLIPQMLYSNVRSIVEQQLYQFDLLWGRAVDAEQRIREIEEGVAPDETRVIGQYGRVEETAMSLAKMTKSDMLILLPTLERLELSSDVFELLRERAVKDKLSVRVLAPFPRDWRVCERIIKRYSVFEIRRIEPIRLGLLISDQTRMLFIQYTDIHSPKLEESVVSGIYATHRQTISGIISIYETMWASSVVREKEVKSRNQAELLQDILTHDIRNYNQVARLSAELLSEEIKDNVPVQSIVESMLKAIDGSTNLLERARRLGKVLSEENPSLYTVDLKDVLRDSISLVKLNFQDRAIECTEGWPRGPTPMVVADDLLGEVFTNLLSNSVKYTESKEVLIDVKVDEASQGDPSMMETSSGTASSLRSFWVVSISDHGRGIPEEVKPRLFSRYLENAKGSGLGMSIVHALVVERYKGAVRVADRVPNDYSKGTLIQVWLPKS